VAVLLGLSINGHVVMERDDRDWMAEFARLLGRQPPQSAIRAEAVKLWWLRN